jgi:hypothetical protein
VTRWPAEPGHRARRGTPRRRPAASSSSGQEQQQLTTASRLAAGPTRARLTRPTEAAGPLPKVSPVYRPRRQPGDPAADRVGAGDRGRVQPSSDQAATAAGPTSWATHPSNVESDRRPAGLAPGPPEDGRVAGTAARPGSAPEDRTAPRRRSPRRPRSASRRARPDPSAAPVLRTARVGAGDLNAAAPRSAAATRPSDPAVMSASRPWSAPAGPRPPGPRARGRSSGRGWSGDAEAPDGGAGHRRERARQPQHRAGRDHQLDRRGATVTLPGGGVKVHCG